MHSKRRHLDYLILSLCLIAGVAGWHQNRVSLYRSSSVNGLVFSGEVAATSYLFKKGIMTIELSDGTTIGFAPIRGKHPIREVKTGQTVRIEASEDDSHNNHYWGRSLQLRDRYLYTTSELDSSIRKNIRFFRLLALVSSLALILYIAFHLKSHLTQRKEDNE